jgi:hypothetical protein
MIVTRAGDGRSLRSLLSFDVMAWTTTRSALTSALLAGTLATAACVNPWPGMARARAADAFSCEQADVELIAMGDGAFQARGCGSTAVFVCSGGPRYGDCVREGEISSHDPTADIVLPEAKPQGPVFDREGARASIKSAVLKADAECAEKPGPHGTGVAVVTFGANGQVAKVELDERFDASETGACMMSHLATPKVAPFATTSGATVRVPFFVRALVVPPAP